MPSPFGVHGVGQRVLSRAAQIRPASACHHFRRRPKAEALSVVEGERCNREPNDLDRAQPITFS
jgi:hypothetical protein